MTGQSRCGQLQAVLQGAVVVGLQRVCQDLLAVGILEREGQFPARLGLRCLVVALRVSKAAHIDGLPRTVDTAVGINVEMVRELVVEVLLIMPPDAFLPVGIVLAAREFDVQIVPLSLVCNISNAALVGHRFFEQIIILPFPFVEADPDALLRFARHSVCHHHALLAVGQRDGHKREGRHGELAKNT